MTIWPRWWQLIGRRRRRNRRIRWTIIIGRIRNIYRLRLMIGWIWVRLIVPNLHRSMLHVRAERNRFVG